MAYENKTISEIIRDINNNKIFLPAIQRKYVWSDQQIIRLMDSIMRDYPIGTMLFWKVKKKTINDREYSMYKFINEYHERDYINPTAPSPFMYTAEDETIWSVLDGQQRLTSLYIALQGCVRRKLPNKRRSNNDAYPKKELYFNLHSKQPEDDDNSYEFKFMTEEETQNQDNGKIWYRIKDILKYNKDDLYTLSSHWFNDEIAFKNIFLLHRRLVEDEKINYYEVEKDSIDDVLDIFVRVNSGGTVLSKSDLLFSTIVSHWDKARDEIDQLLTNINKKGEGFNFNNDFIIRCSLYCMDLPIKLKVETFKKESVLKIKENWNKICQTIKDTIDLLVDFGFNKENILSSVAITPIAYYIFKNNSLSESDKTELKKYFVAAQIKQIFGASTNNALTKIRDKLKILPAGSFRLSFLNDIEFTGGRTLHFTAEEIDGFFSVFEKGSYTFMLLTLLYPNLKYSQKAFHQDHMHPYSGFEEKNIDKGLKLPDGSTINSETIKDWQSKRNTLANLQLLEGRENESKNDKPLIEWLEDDSNRQNVKYLPINISYSLNNFDEFIIERQKLMSAELKRILI